MGQLFGPIKGGLGYSVIIVGFILGAITGTVAGQVIAMALIALPVMVRYGYNMRYATGVLAASGTITQLVPPSLVLVVLADQLGRSVGDMYKGAWGPSILQVIMFAIFTFIVAKMRPEWVPGVPKEARTLSGKALVYKCLRGIIPSAALIFMVLGSMGGLPGMSTAICTPTEAGAMGVVGAFVLAALQRRLTFPLIWLSMQSTARISAMVVFILIGSTMFSLVFQGVDGGLWIEHKLSDLPGGVVGFLIFVNIFIFILAFFLDFFEIAFIIIPLLAPVAQKMGIDLIWFGVMICVNMQTSFMHPPFGFALFYLQGIADTLYKDKRIPHRIKTSDVYLGAIPWVILQLILVGIVIAWPGLVTNMLDKPLDIDATKIEVKIEALEDTPKVGDAPKETGLDDKGNAKTDEKIAEDAQKAADNLADDLQKQLGGAVDRPDGKDAKEAAPRGAKTEEDKAAADIEKMLKAPAK